MTYPESGRSTSAADSAARLPCVCTAVRRADRALNRLYDDALRPSGLTTTQYALLSRLSRAGAPIRHHHLAEVQLLAATTLSRNLTPLVKKGYVRISPGQDRRTRLVSITPAGEEAFARARPLWQSVQERIVADAGQERIGHLLDELSDLVARLR